MNGVFRLSNKQAAAGLVIVLVLAVVLASLFMGTALGTTGGELGVPLDDAWIHFQFARNLSQGDGFSFNPGQPTPGSTAPLWTVLLAAVGLVSQAFLPAAIILSGLFYLLAITLAYGLARELSGKPAIGLIAAGGVLVSGRLVWAGLAGMETTLFSALSLAGVWVYSRKGLKPAAALLFGLASQARPEGHVLFALALADTLWTTYRRESRIDGGGHRWRSLLRRLAVPIMLYVLISLPYALFSLSQTGRPLANTFYAKVDGSQLFSLRTLRETAVIHFRDNPVAFVLLVPGIVQTWPRSRLVVGWLVLLPILSAFMVDFIWHHGRYTMPLIPFVVVAAAQGVEWLVDRTPAKARRVAAGLLVVAMLAAGAWQLPRWAEQLGLNSREIITVDVALGEWLAENTPAEAVIAVDDIGAIGYLSGRTIFDLNGLITPDMWGILHDEPQGVARNQATMRLLSEIGADYLAIFPLWHWEIATNAAVARPVTTFRSDSRTILGEWEAVVYEANWPYVEEAPAAEEPVATLGDRIELLAYEFKVPGSPEQPLEVTLRWRSLEALQVSYDVFVHILGPDNLIAAQTDGKPVHGLAPTSRWQPGDIIVDRYLVELPAGLPGGAYRVQAGMYLRESGQRLPAVALETIDDAIQLGAFSWPADENDG